MEALSVMAFMTVSRSLLDCGGVLTFQVVTGRALWLSSRFQAGEATGAPGSLAWSQRAQLSSAGVLQLGRSG